MSNGNANAARKQLADVGQYPLYSTVCVAAAQATDLRMFSYKLGDALPGAIAGAIATELETNMEVGGQIGSGMMRVESIGLSWWAYGPATIVAAAYYPTSLDVARFDAHSMFRFEVNGKVFAHGRFTMFPAGHGLYGSTDLNNAEIMSNGVPTFQARGKGRGDNRDDAAYSLAWAIFSTRAWAMRRPPCVPPSRRRGSGPEYIRISRDESFTEKLRQYGIRSCV